VPNRVIGDPIRLRQIVTNLVGNAIKFTQAGEVIARVEPHHEAEGRICLLFEVQDTGIGIPEDRQQEIFQAFEQADAATTRQYGGTGLGLAISSNLVSMMGGTLNLESKVGSGSTFRFTAWFDLADTSTSVAAEEGLDGLEGLPVLVVDDSTSHLNILCEMLRGWRMSPRPCRSGREAIRAMETMNPSDRPAVVICDVAMPDISGLDVLNWMREMGVLESTALLLLSSAEAVEPAELEGLNAAVLAKPIRRSALLNQIQAVVADATSAAAAATASTPDDDDMPADQVAEAHAAPVARRVLLVEDNLVNQRMAVHLLEKHHHEVVVADNGRGALDALEREEFDVVLMDMQMPVMDGLEAVRRIREKEAQASGGLRVPIVALTAHAMRGDRERCLAAGMDGYVSKPFQPHVLFREMSMAIGRAASESGVTHPLGEASAEGAAAPEKAEPQAEERVDENEVFDTEQVQQYTLGDRDLLAQLFEMFAEDVPQITSDLEEAIGAGDAESTRQLAHRLKGAVASLAGNRARDAAFALERAGESGDLSTATDLLETLRVELARFDEVVRRHLSKSET